MTKEELLAQGWDVHYSGPPHVKAWGEHMIHLRHPNGRMVSGYGIDENAALADVTITINKPLANVQNEIRH